MKSVIVASLTVLLGVTQAQALSCVRSDVARTFAWASEADENYIILRGAFDFAQSRAGVQPSAKQLEATFEGSYLSAGGFVAAPTLDVTLNFECLGPWCGSINAGEEFLTFVEQTSNGYVLRVGPCYSTAFQSDEQNVQTAESCMRGGPCVERNF